MWLYVALVFYQFLGPMSVVRPTFIWSSPQIRIQPQPISPFLLLSIPFALQVLLHNCPISPLLKQCLESEHLPCMGAGPFTRNPLLSLNAPFVPFIITIQRECHTLPNGKTVAAVWATARTFTLLLIAFWFLGEIIIADCHAILTKRLNFHFICFKILLICSMAYILYVKKKSHHSISGKVVRVI